MGLALKESAEDHFTSIAWPLPGRILGRMFGGVVLELAGGTCPIVARSSCPLRASGKGLSSDGDSVVHCAEAGRQE